MTHLDPSRVPGVSPGGTRYYHMGYAIKMHWKKIDHFSNCCQIAKYPSKFKILTIFSILRFLPFRIRRERRQNRRFWTSPGRFSKNCRKSGPFFLQISFLDHLKIVGPYEFGRIQTGTTFLISKLSNFLKFEAYLAIWWPIENWTGFFQCIL